MNIRDLPARRTISLAYVALLLSLASSASFAPHLSAQEGSARDRATARALFQDGVECSDREDWACAVDRFSRAYAVRASPVIASNFGHALVHLGRFVEAAEMLGEVVRAETANEQLREDARATLEEIRPRLGRLTVRLAGSAEGITLTIDGREFPASLLGVAGPADPGDHTLEAHRDGHVVATAAAHVEPGGAAEVVLAIPEPVIVEPTVVADLSARAEEDRVVASLETPIAPPPRSAEVYEEWWFWTVIGVVVVGAAAVTIGVVATPGPAYPAGSLGTIDGR